MNIQGNAGNLLGVDDGIGGGVSDGLGGGTERGEPDHDFDVGVLAVLGLLLVLVQEHIHGDVGVDVVGGELIDVRVGLSGRVAHGVRPLEVQRDGVDVADGGREDTGVDLDVREGVHGLVLVARREHPCHGPLGCRGLCWVSLVVPRRDLLQVLSASVRDRRYSASMCAGEAAIVHTFMQIDPGSPASQPQGFGFTTREFRQHIGSR